MQQLEQRISLPLNTTRGQTELRLKALLTTDNYDDLTFSTFNLYKLLQKQKNRNTQKKNKKSDKQTELKTK